MYMLQTWSEHSFQDLASVTHGHGTVRGKGCIHVTCCQFASGMSRQANQCHTRGNWQMLAQYPPLLTELNGVFVTFCMLIGHKPWHEILHHWNGRIQQLKCKPWSEMCLQHHWNLAHYFALLPDHRWFKRVLHWNPCGWRRVGRPKNSWDTILENFCRLKGLPSWEVAAMDQDLWSSSLAEFLHFCKMIMYI